MKLLLFEPETQRHHLDHPRAMLRGVSCYAAATTISEYPVPLRRGHISMHGSLGSEAFEEEKHVELRKRLVSAVRAVCPKGLLDRQDDLVQTAMMAVLKQEAKHGRSREIPASYLRRAAYTAMVDEIRRLRSRNEVPLETEEGGDWLPPEREDPERRALSNEISSAVRACLQRLATPRRLAVTMHLLSFSVPQIAEYFHWKPKQADNLVYRGLANLRQCLESKEIRP